MGKTALPSYVTRLPEKISGEGYKKIGSYIYRLHERSGDSITRTQLELARALIQDPTSTEGLDIKTENDLNEEKESGNETV